MGSSHSDESSSKSWRRGSYKPVFSREKIDKILRDEKMRNLTMRAIFINSLEATKNESSALWMQFHRHFEEYFNQTPEDAQQAISVNLGDGNQQSVSYISQPIIYEADSLLRAPNTEDQSFATDRIRADRKIMKDDDTVFTLVIRESMPNARIQHGSTRLTVGQHQLKTKLDPRLIITAPFSAKDELDRLLYYLLKKNYKHLIWTILRLFQNKLIEKFCVEQSKFSLIGDLEEIKKVYENVCFIIKSFVRLINDFVYCLYKNYITKMLDGLSREEYQVAWIIDSLVYEILFSQHDSIVSKLVFGLFRKINASKINKLRSMMLEKRLEKLEDDNILMGESLKFILRGDPTPYKPVIQKISDIKLTTNPYNKFETILSLERLILACAKEHYKNEPSVQRSLDNSFSMDVKFSIIMYCVLKSQHEEIAMDNAFIEEFIERDCLEVNQNFTTFMGVISAVLLEGY